MQKNEFDFIIALLFFWSEWFGRCSTIARPQIYIQFFFSCYDNFALTLWYEIFNYFFVCSVRFDIRHNKEINCCCYCYYYLKESKYSSGHTRTVYTSQWKNDNHPTFNRFDVSIVKANHDKESKISPFWIEM